MQSDLRSEEDMSFMTYSEPQFFLFIIAINHMKIPGVGGGAGGRGGGRGGGGVAGGRGGDGIS